ncbi:MAG: cytochrome c peroxidase [Pseudohongiellaceae bacterium]
MKFPIKFYKVTRGIGLLLLMLSCKLALGAETELRLEAQALFGTIDPVTSEEMNAPKIALGRALFWDESLSVNKETACASCHLAGDWGADRRERSLDARGKLTRRHSQSVFNTQAAVAGLRWLADRPSGAAQATGSVTGSMGFAEREDLIAALRLGNYESHFETVFAEQSQPLTVANYAQALQAYQESLRTPAALDRWLSGDDQALTAQQRRGMRRFIDTGCAACHDGALLGGNRLAKFGVLSNYRALTGSDAGDTGQMLATGNEVDRDLFRIQPLRNVAQTAPYFHDGSVATLAEAVNIMAQVQLGQQLSSAEVAEIVAFLHTLSGEVPLHFSAP